MTMPTTASDSSAEDAATDLGEKGWVVMPERLPSGFVDQLAAAFEPLLDRYVAEYDPNRGVRRHQMYVPFEPPFSDVRLWGNPAVLDVVERVLGADVECTYYGSDTPFPGADHQPVHTDGAPLFPEWPQRPPPYALALNVPLTDVDDDLGPLECFAGPDEPGPDAEPVRFTVPAGTCVLRDTRVWHRGSPNRGDRPRPMLALLYTRSWYRFVLDRPAMSRTAFDALPERGRRLFRGADVTPRRRSGGDRARLTTRPT